MDPFTFFDTLPHRRRRNATLRFLPFLALILLSLLFNYNSMYRTLSRIIRINASSSLSDEQEEKDEERYNGVYPESLITLFYPYTLLSDVVLAQPIPESDIPFFWHLHKSDELIMKRVLTNCLNLQIVELNTLDQIQNARDVQLVNTLNRRTHVITSPFLRETAEIFNIKHFARVLSFFRHPLDYDLHPALPTFEQKDNWLVRYLSDQHEMYPLTFKELGVAKHVVRECCLVGTLDKMTKSILRWVEHMDWHFDGDDGNGEGHDDDSVQRRGEQCIQDALVEYNAPKDTYLDHDTEQWKRHYEMNRYDCEVYEIARSAWRAQIQTIIPYRLQISRDEEKKRKEEEKKKKKKDKGKL